MLFTGDSDLQRVYVCMLGLEVAQLRTVAVVSFERDIWMPPSILRFLPPRGAAGYRTWLVPRALWSRRPRCPSEPRSDAPMGLRSELDSSNREPRFHPIETRDF